jgi:hypothetical protein
MRALLTLLLSAAVLCHASVCPAQPVDAATKATARQLGEDGMKLYDRGECTEAAEKLTRAHELVHVPTLAFYAGKCLEKLGRLVEASERYLEATRDAVDAGAPRAQKAAQADAEKARKALLPRLAYVEIVLKPIVPDASVTLDGKPLPAAALGIKRPIDPGDHEVVVVRAGVQTPRKLSLKEGESVHVEVEVPAAPAAPAYPYPGPTYPQAPSTAPAAPGLAPAPTPYYAPPYVAAPPTTPSTLLPPMRRYSTGLFVGGLILIPASTIGLIGGAVLAAGSGSDRPSGAAVLTVSLLGLGGGIAMTAIGGRRVPDTTAVSFEPLVGPTSAGLRVRF